MAAVVVQSSTPVVENIATGNFDISASWGTATTAGNVLFAIFTSQVTDTEVDTPAGWTRLAARNVESPTGTFRGCVIVFSKEAAGSDAGVTVGWAPDEEQAALSLMEVSGLDTGQIPTFTDISIGTAISESSVVTQASVVNFAAAAAGDAMFYAMYGRGSAWIPVVMPGGFAKEKEAGSSNVMVSYGHDLDGGTTTLTSYGFDSGNSGGWVAIVLFSWPLSGPSGQTVIGTAVDVTAAVGVGVLAPYSPPAIIEGTAVVATATVGDGALASYAPATPIAGTAVDATAVVGTGVLFVPDPYTLYGNGVDATATVGTGVLYVPVLIGTGVVATATVGTGVLHVPLGLIGTGFVTTATVGAGVLIGSGVAVPPPSLPFGGVVHWKFTDPVSLEEYEFEMNPGSGGVPDQERKSVYSERRLDNKIVQFELPEDARETQFTGTLLTEAQYVAFEAWARKRSPFILTDDLGREYGIIAVGFEPRRERRSSAPWYHTYTFKYVFLPSFLPRSLA